MDVHLVEKATGRSEHITIELDATVGHLAGKAEERAVRSFKSKPPEFEVVLEHGGAVITSEKDATIAGGTGIASGDEVLFSVKYCNKGLLSEMAQLSTKFNKAPDWARHDPEVCELAVRICPSDLQYIPREMCTLEMALLAVTHPASGDNLEHCRLEHREDINVVLEAVRSSGTALRHAAGDLNSNVHVCLAAVRRTPAAMNLVSDALRNDKAFVQRCAKYAGACLAQVPPQLRDDPDVVQEAVRHTSESIKHASDRLKGDTDFLLQRIAPVKLNALKYLSPETKAALLEPVQAEYGEALAKKYLQEQR